MTATEAGTAVAMSGCMERSAEFTPTTDLDRGAPIVFSEGERRFTSPHKERKSIMKKSIRSIILATALIGTILPATASAEVAADYSVDFASAYVWRGVTFLDGLSMQPSMTVSHDSGFSANVWGAFDIDDANGNGGNFQELDITLGYNLALGEKSSLDIGLINYNFPNYPSLSESSTNELFVGWSGDFVAQPAVTLYYDFDAVEGFYANFSVGHSFPVSDTLGIDIGANFGYSSEDFATSIQGGTESGFSDGTIQVGFSWGPEGNWGLAGFVAYTDTLDDMVLATQPVDFWGLIGISGTF